MEYQAIIIGGGYFGCSISLHLARAGVRTLLLDKGEIGSGASGANFGNVQVQDCNMGLSYELTLRGFERMRHIEAELGMEIGYRPQPSLIGAEKEAHIPELRKLYEEKKEAGLDIRWLEGQQISELEPNLKPGAVLAATYFEQGSVYPFRYLYAMVKAARSYGLTVLENAPVDALLLEGGACKGALLRGGQTLRAEHVVVAAGAGTRALCLGAGLDVPVYSVKAEGLVTEPLKPFLRTYYSSAAFFAEAHSQECAATTLCIGQSHYGNLLIAETTKPHQWVDAAYQDTTSLEHVRNIRERLFTFFPVLKDIQVLRSWVTASPYTDSCEPALGESPVPGLILASGFKSAVILSAVAGEIVKDIVCKGKSEYDLAPFISQVGAVVSSE